MKNKLLIICIFALLAVPAVHAAVNLKVTAFSCSPAEVKIANQFTCTATIQNNGDVNGTLNTATLYPDTSNWLENSNYAQTVNSAINSGASVDVTFTGLKGKKSGVNGFSKIMLDDSADTYVADSGSTVNVIDVAVTATNSASSAASGSSVNVATQATAGGNVDITLSMSIVSGGCSIGSQPSSATTNNLNNGQTTSHTWALTLGTNNCTYSVSANAMSNPGSITSKTDTVTGTIRCSNCVGANDTTSSSSSGGGGGGGGGAVSDSQTIAKSLIQKGELAIFAYTTEKLAITEVDVTAANEMKKTELGIAYLSSKPSAISQEPAKSVYKYLNFIATNLSSAEKITIKFRVNKTWISNNSLDADKIYLYRYTTQWEKLTTTKSSSDDNYYNYWATSPGFSYFAIAAEPLTAESAKPSETIKNITQPSAPEQPAEQPAGPEQKPGTSPAGQIYQAPGEPIKIPSEYLIIGVLIIILALGWFYYHGHKKLAKIK